MPSENAPDGVNVALQPDQDAVIPRIALNEQGFVGLKVSNKRILEETVAAFRYPAFIKTVNEMRNNPTVGAAMNIWKTMISRVKWDIEPPEDADEVDKQRTKICRSMMDDMEHSWANFIESVIPYLEYGFSINEIVLRRRLSRNGSRWNDGLVGIRKLSPRSQDTICGWVFSEDGSELLKVEQDIANLENSYRFQNRKNENGKIEISREKFLLFSASSTKGNPEGNSIFKNIYLAHKQLTLLQEQELLGIAKDIQGILKICIPPRYMDPNASAEDKAVLAAFQKIIDNYSAGTQRGLLVPNMIDPESKLPLFTYDLLESRGGSKYDTESVIRRLQGDILSALSVDILKLGAEGTGSFSLAQTKTSVLALAIDYRLKEIAEVLNHSLIPTIYKMNGWSTERLPKFVYADVEEVDSDTYSKAIQRIMSVGGVECDRALFNRTRKVLGIPELPENEPVDKEKLPANMSNTQSRAGDGMASPTGNGTAKDPFDSDDNSVGNNENS